MRNMYTGKIYADMEVTVIRGPMKQNYGAVMDTSVSKDGAISVVVHIETRIPPCVIRFPEDDVLERLYVVDVCWRILIEVFIAPDYHWPKRVGCRRMCGVGL